MDKPAIIASSLMLACCIMLAFMSFGYEAFWLSISLVPIHLFVLLNTIFQGLKGKK